MNNLFLATTLDGSLAQIVEKLNVLMDSFWKYIVLALAAVIVVWGAYIGIKIAIAHKNEEKINARDTDNIYSLVFTCRIRFMMLRLNMVC
ncbi:MAG: hypothetical protein E7357_06085 [Clostridiales bacterium]|nr:hypothetical protein [Clostridiales bacterium]